MKTILFHHTDYSIEELKGHLDALQVNVDLFEHARSYHHLHQQNTEKANTSISIYAYDHGSICFSDSPFSCEWDSGKVGSISFEDIGEVNNEKLIEQVIKQLDAFYQNDQYCFIDECGVYNVVGTYDDAISYAKEEGLEPHFS